MTRHERMKAFAMRLDGMTWGQIADVLHYDPRHIPADLKSVLDKPPKATRIIYPAIAEFVRTSCSGSIEVLAERMCVSPYRLRRVIVNGDEPSAKLKNKLLKILNMDESEAFAVLEHPDITRALETGYPHGEPKYPRCPVCGAEADTFYRDKYRNIVGCDECVSTIDAWEEVNDS